MCNRYSCIMSPDLLWEGLPGWEMHSHSTIALLHRHTLDNLTIDRYARIEVYPTRGWTRWAQLGQAPTPSDLEVSVDEQRTPDWWRADRVACEDRAKQAAIRYFNRDILPAYASGAHLYDDSIAWKDSDGDYHRTDGPATAENGRFYYLHGKCHRLDGPAYERIFRKNLVGCLIEAYYVAGTFYWERCRPLTPGSEFFTSAGSQEEYEAAVKAYKHNNP